MNHRERIMAALHHESGKVPIDFGSTHATGMHVSCVEALRDHYGLDKHPVKVHEPYQMLGEIEDDLAEAMGTDISGFQGPKTIFGFKNENWKKFRTLWGQDVLVSEHFNTTTDEKGDILLYPQGDTSAPPSARMPVSGYFFDTIIRQEAFDEDNLNPEDNLEEFGLISDEDLAYYVANVERLEKLGRPIITYVGSTSLGSVTAVTGPSLKHPKGIRDIEEWYISNLTRQDYLHQIFSQQCEIALENLKRLHEVIENKIDILFVCGSDFGTQTSTFFSTETFETLYAPYYKQINQWIHENTLWKTFKHSCGSVVSLLPLFIDSGFDIINPVQCSAAGMDPKTLKAHYGDHLVFWGGGVNTQKTLPYQTPEDVRVEVLERCEIFSENGGYVFNAIHNVQAKTPLANIVAMINAAKEFNGEI
ncbi:MAG TPA: uroporphyrinogen decarboxylase family protein [Arenicellales bacterium]|nr:uroporphyrinogen decarboxylase family protein [Arenicellales bacterium]